MERVVVGLPLSLRGDDTDQTRETREFAASARRVGSARACPSSSTTSASPRAWPQRIGGASARRGLARGGDPAGGLARPRAVGSSPWPETAEQTRRASAPPPSASARAKSANAAALPSRGNDAAAAAAARRDARPRSGGAARRRRLDQPAPTEPQPSELLSRMSSAAEHLRPSPGRTSLRATSRTAAPASADPHTRRPNLRRPRMHAPHRDGRSVHRPHLPRRVLARARRRGAARVGALLALAVVLALLAAAAVVLVRRAQRARRRRPRRRS